VAPGLRLLGALQQADPDGVAQGAVVSTDLFYGAEDREPAWRAAGAAAVEMEAATLFTLAGRREIEAGCVLVVSDLVGGERQRIAPEALLEAERRMGEFAIRALSMS
jgi:uridine phosphorylase